MLHYLLAQAKIDIKSELMREQTIEIHNLANGWCLKLSIVGLSLMLSAIPASADQCLLIPKQQAIAAMSRLEPGQTIYSLCELCGERKPQPIKIKTIELVNEPSSKLWQIKVNDREIDLAYIYVRSQDFNARNSRDSSETNSQINLSLIAKCPAKGFTPIISIK
jgi:hypothetical protein